MFGLNGPIRSSSKGNIESVVSERATSCSSDKIFEKTITGCGNITIVHQPKAIPINVITVSQLPNRDGAQETFRREKFRQRSEAFPLKLLLERA